MSGSCVQVCDKATALVHMPAAAAALSKPYSYFGGQRWMFLSWIIQDMGTDTGIKSVHLFVKKCYADWHSRNKCAPLST